MASLYPSFSLSSLAAAQKGSSMDLFDTHRRVLSRAKATRRILSPCICHWIQLKNDIKVTLQLRIHARLIRSPVMSTRNGDPTMTCKGLCVVIWSIEADIADDELLFITGDPVALGCWEPERAVLLSPSIEHSNFWKAEIRVPLGSHFKYNYFIKQKGRISCKLVWRPGPEFSMSIPVISGENEVIVVKDSWMKTIHKPPIPSWGSWMIDVVIPNLQFEHGSGENEMLITHNGGLLKGEQCSVDSMTNNSINVPEFRNSSESLTEIDQPVEEPWLLQSTLISMLVLGDGNIKPLYHNPQKLSPENEQKLGRLDEPASTVIIINSSVCTMQRIAVLEDGKLAELLLEPVKNNVQCDSVYLGVVTKLVPHMGGAFVDIGISRPSLMEIKKIREPFVYPPFYHELEKEQGNVSLDVEPEEQLNNHVLYQSSDDDDDDDNDDDDDIDVIDVSESIKLNMGNGSIDTGGDEADIEEDYEGNGRDIYECLEDHIPLEEETSTGSGLLHLIQDVHASADIQSNENKWAHVCKGTKVIVQVVKEGLGTKGPALTAYPNLKSRFWILISRCNIIGVSKKITGVERTRLRVIAKTLQPPGFGLTVRTVSAGHSMEELKKDLDGILSTWKGIIENAKSAALAADEGVEGAIPVMLHRPMGQTLSVVQDYFNEKVKKMVVDSPRTYHEVTSYLQEIAPGLCDRVELYDKRTPIFDEYDIEEEINNILSKRIPLSNGGSLVIEQTEALVSIDVNGGHGMLGQGTSQEKAVLDVNLAAVKQIARELRLRDIGGIIVIDFIDMADESNKRLVYEEMKKAVERDRSMVEVSELSKHGLMEITRKRVRPSVTFMISEPCACCHATGRVEALETSFSKIEHEICRLLAHSDQRTKPENAKLWPRFVLKVDRNMSNYLTSGKRTKLTVLSSSLKVWILLKVARGLPRGGFEVKPFTDEKANDEQQVAISRLRPTEARTYIPSTKLTLFPIKKWRSRGK